MPAKKKELSVFSKVEINVNQYKMIFRCSNCGIFFEVAIQKGLPALKVDPTCTYCGVTKKAAGGGEIVQANSTRDEELQFYP
jgi:hypothetical protein